MENRKTLLFVSLAVMAVTALVTALIIKAPQKDNGSPESQVPQITATPTILPTNIPQETPSVGLVTGTPQVTGKPPQYVISSPNNYLEPVSSGLPDNSIYYLINPTISCPVVAATCEMYFIRKNDVKTAADKSILQVADSAIYNSNFEDDYAPTMPTYALFSQKRTFSHAEPRNLSYYFADDFDLYINGTYQGLDDLGNGVSEHKFLMYSRYSTSIVFLIPVTYDSQFTELKNIRPGDIVSMKGVLIHREQQQGRATIELRLDS